MSNDVKDNPTPPSDKRIIRRIIAAAMSLLIAVYVIFVISGLIPKENRLEIGESGLIILIGVVVAIILNPDFLQRLSLIKLPGGIEMTLTEIVRRQEKQQSELNDVRFMLTYLLSVAEHAHLHAMILGKADDYLLHKPLRDELRKLKQLGMLEELPGSSIDDVRDGIRIDLKKYFKLTPRAYEYLGGIAKSAQDHQR